MTYDFDKTKVYEKLYKAGTVFISRSQARRVTANLGKFKKVIMDFKGIESVGQAFADEIFRVFTQKHPQIEIESVNMKEPVEFMISRVKKGEQQKISKVISFCNMLY